MVLISDSGATKAEWKVIIHNQEVKSFATSGISPHYQNTEEMYQALKTELVPQLQQTPDEIFFYGTACSTDKNKKMVKTAFQNLFPETKKISIEHDLLSAARALCGHQAGMACIAGTGSNACFYDGTQIIWQPVNLGFLLGDEGSGAYLGKTLVTAFMHEELPPHLMEKFKAAYQLTRDDLLVNIYQKPYPNRYLATFSKFLYLNQQDLYCHGMIAESFSVFFEKYVCKYKTYRNHPVHFVGSIAFYYRNILQEVATQKEIKLGNILKTPIEGLVSYHLDQPS